MELTELIKKTKALNILYVEDDEILRITTISIFEIFFDNIFVATNGMEGLEVFEINKIDLIITDINMPIMNGIEMSNNIRTKNQTVPIFVTTGYSKDDITKELNFKENNINGCIFKPIQLEQLVEELEKVTL